MVCGMRNIAAVLLVTGLLLTGCAGTPEADPTPTPTASFAELLDAAKYPESYEAARDAFTALEAAVAADCAPGASAAQQDALDDTFAADKATLADGTGAIDGDDFFGLGYTDLVENVCASLL